MNSCTKNAHARTRYSYLFIRINTHRDNCILTQSQNPCIHQPGHQSMSVLSQLLIHPSIHPLSHPFMPRLNMPAESRLVFALALFPVVNDPIPTSLSEQMQYHYISVIKSSCVNMGWRKMGDGHERHYGQGFWISNSLMSILGLQEWQRAVCAQKRRKMHDTHMETGRNENSIQIWSMTRQKQYRGKVLYIWGMELDSIATMNRNRSLSF